MSGPSRPGAPPKTFAYELRSWLAHPLFLLLAGSIVTGLLVPYFTGKWQHAQTAQDMKTRVITDVGDAVATGMTQLEIDMNPVLNSGVANNRLNNPHAIAGSYNAWTMKATNVTSEVGAYFPENNIPDHWKHLQNLVHNFFLLTYASDPGMRQHYIFALRHYFEARHTNAGIDWAQLQPDTPWTDQYRANWNLVDNQIQNVKNNLVSSIMDAPAPSF